MRWFVRLCGVRNHRPYLRQTSVQSIRDYPPAMLAPAPHDKEESIQYHVRDSRRAVEPPKDVNDVPECINDSKYPVPGWRTTWTLNMEDPNARPQTSGIATGAEYKGWMH